MYRIDEEQHKETYNLIVPATLDAHFPLLKYMFWSKEYRVEILENTEGIVDVGLRYANNEICFPFILMAGQVIQTLRKEGCDVAHTRLLIPTAGDACRGANYIGAFRRALKHAHLEDCKVVTLNVRHVEEDINLPMGYDMAIRGLFGMFYGDILMLLSNQVRPYERNEGETDRLWAKWIDRLSEDLKSGKHLTRTSLYQNFDRMCEEFLAIERRPEKKQRIGLVGEFYAKYCSLGNWDVQKYMEDQGCEVHVNGLSWYALYYIDTHLPKEMGVERTGFLAARKLILRLQNRMIACLEKHGFYTLPNLDVLKEQSKDYVSEHFEIGDGWLLGAEVIGNIQHDCRKVLCVAPFGCMANACAGRGLYPYLQRCFPGSLITSVETDASGSQGNYYNRVQMLIHGRTGS